MEQSGKGWRVVLTKSTMKSELATIKMSLLSTELETPPLSPLPHPVMPGKEEP